MLDFSKIHFAHVQPEQENLVLSWFEKAHVKEWFHGVGLQNSIKGLKKFVTNDNPDSELWIGYYGQEPYAYLITSDVTELDIQDENSPHAKWAESGKKMITLDLFIGDEKFLGKGLAVPTIKTFILDKFSEADIVFIDPEMSNTKAIHVYEKAGFKRLGEFIASWHPVPHQMMRLYVQELR